MSNMQFSNKLQYEIIRFLTQDTRFNYHGCIGTHFMLTWPKGDKSEGDFIDLKKSHSEKDLAKVQIHVFTSIFPTEEVEFSIKMYLNSYLQWDCVFEGWAENIDEFKMAFKMVGL